VNDPASRPAFGASIAKNITNRELNQARTILGIIGVVTIALNAVGLNDLHRQVAALGEYYDHALVGKLELWAYAGIGVGLVYLVCAFLVPRMPVIMTVTGLGLFIGTIGVQAILDVTILLSVFGAGLRIAILIALISAVKFARVYERNRRAEADFPTARITS
jgi:hypothetical protein